MILYFFRVLSLLLAVTSVGLLLGLGPFANRDYQALSFMHLLVIVSFYSSLSYFKKDVKFIATHYDLRRTMERTIKKTGTTMVQTFTVFSIVLVWLLPLLLAGLWYAAGRIQMDVYSVGMPFLWSVFSLCAAIYLCLLNPIVRFKYK